MTRRALFGLRVRKQPAEDTREVVFSLGSFRDDDEHVVAPWEKADAERGETCNPCNLCDRYAEQCACREPWLSPNR